jgi:hypothetical protein
MEKGNTSPRGRADEKCGPNGRSGRPRNFDTGFHVRVPGFVGTAPTADERQDMEKRKRALRPERARQAKRSVGG